jgi:hypothetical protein
LLRITSACAIGSFYVVYRSQWPAFRFIFQFYLYVYKKEEGTRGPGLQTRELKLYNSIDRRFHRFPHPRQWIGGLEGNVLCCNSFMQDSLLHERDMASHEH